jgi:hypothetical protein
MQLIGGLSAGLHRRPPDQPQGPDHLNLAIASLGLPDDGAGLDRPGGGFGIERIRLPPSSPRLAAVVARTLDFDDRHAMRSKPARQPGTITPGALDPDLFHYPEARRPRQQLGAARGRRRDTPGAQPSAKLVERHSDVLIGVRVDPDGDPNLAVLGSAAG